MKLAVSSSGPNLDNRMEARFGRCPYFILIDPEPQAMEAIKNPNITLSGGAGIQSAQLLAEKKITTVLTGNCGPKAFQVFDAAGIQVITGVDGTVREAVEKFKSGSLSSARAPSVDAHFGTADSEKTGTGPAIPNNGEPPQGRMPVGIGSGQTGAGMGMGSGMGRGMGRGGGGGKGCGMGRGMGMRRGMGMMGAGGGAAPPAVQLQTGNPREEEMKLLKHSAENLRRQLDSIESRINKITIDTQQPESGI